MTRHSMFFGGVGVGILCSMTVAQHPQTMAVMMFMGFVFLAAAWFMRNPPA